MRNFIITSNDSVVAEGVVFRDGICIVYSSNEQSVTVIKTVEYLERHVDEMNEGRIVWSSTLL